MLPLETKRSGGKLLPHSDLRGGVFLEEVSRNRQRKRDIVLDTWNVRSLYRAGSLAQDRERWRVLVSTVRNFRVPKMRGISWLAAEPVSFSRRTLLHGVSTYKLIIWWTFIMYKFLLEAGKIRCDATIDSYQSEFCVCLCVCVCVCVCVWCVASTHVGLQAERLTNGSHRIHKGRRQIRGFAIFDVRHMEVVEVALNRCYRWMARFIRYHQISAAVVRNASYISGRLLQHNVEYLPRKAKNISHI
jgi:hypothetical protein